MSSCSRHASKEAVGACINCGELVCAACHKEIEGKSYCPVCVEKLTKSVEVKSGQISSAVTASVKPAPMPAETGKIVAAPGLEKTGPVQGGVPQSVSGLWWLLPVFLAWVGGLAAWLVIKDKSPQKARNMLFSGIGISLIQGILAVILVFALCVPAVVNQGHNPPTASTDQTSSGASATDRQTSAATDNQKTSVTSTTGQTQIGQTPVATNSEVIEVRGPSNTQIKSPTPATDYKLTTLSDQAVQPSDKDQTVSYADKLQVTIPGGQLKESQKLVISAVGNPPAPSSHETQLAVYDISFEKQHEFDSNLTFKFTYDPALVAGDLPPQMALQVAVFDEYLHLWAPIPSSVDSDSNTITVQAPHNGMWQVVKEIYNREVVLTEHCAVYYYPSLFWTPKVVRYDTLRKIYKAMVQAKYDGLENAEAAYHWTSENNTEYELLKNGPDVQDRLDQFDYKGSIPAADSHYYNDNLDIPKYVVDVGYFADKAWDKYKKKFGKEPYTQELVLATPDKLSDKSTLTGAEYRSWYSTSAVAFPIYIQSEYISPCYYGVSKAIYIGYTQTVGDLAGTISHEMFHAVQHRDYSMAFRQSALTKLLTLGKASDIWWLDGTAEYAAYKIATGNPSPSSKSINSDYLFEDFYSNALLGSESPGSRTYEALGDANHPYKNAYFFDYLVNKCSGDFVEMYKHALGFNLPSSGLDDYLKWNISNRVGDVPTTRELYRRFAAFLVMDEQSPMDKSGIDTEEFQLGNLSLDCRFFNSHGLTSNVICVKPEVDGSKGSRVIQVSIIEHIGTTKGNTYLQVDVYNLEGGRRLPTEYLEPIFAWNDADEPNADFLRVLGDIKVKPGDEIYIFVTTYNTDIRSSVRLMIKGKYDPQLSIVPPPEIPVGGKGTTCTPYTFEAKSVDMPPGVTYKWYIDDVEISGKDTSMTHEFEPGPHSIKVVAKWGQGDTAGQKDAHTKFYVGNPKLTIRGPKELKEGEKGTMGNNYTHWVEPEYVPSSAKYTWRTGVTGTEHSFKVLGPGKITDKVTAAWDVNGCKGTVDGLTEFEIANQSIDINASPAIGTKDMPTIFTATGQYIPKNTMFSWDLGDNTGLSTEKIDTPVPHTYTIAGIYDVTVTVFDAQKHTGATKTIQYKVKAPAVLATVTIVPPPDIAVDKGLPKMSYRFVAAGENIPGNAIYTWSMGARELGQGESIPLNFSAAGAYTLKLVARWTDGGGQPQQAEAKLDLRISEPATTLPQGHGWYLVKTKTGSDPLSCSQTSCTWSECKSSDSQIPQGSNPLGNIYGSKPPPCDKYPITISWTQLPLFLKPNSDFDCSVIISPSDYVYSEAKGGLTVLMGVIGEDLIYENYYDLPGRYKIWIPDGSKTTVPFFNESKLAGKTLQIKIRDFALYQYEYR